MKKSQKQVREEVLASLTWFCPRKPPALAVGWFTPQRIREWARVLPPEWRVEAVGEDRCRRCMVAQYLREQGFEAPVVMYHYASVAHGENGRVDVDLPEEVSALVWAFDRLVAGGDLASRDYDASACRAAIARAWGSA